MLQPLPTFSIIIPCYNEVGAIEETLAGICKAVGEKMEFELLVVDDGSNDGTAEVLNRVSLSTGRLRVITHARNRGYGAALKTGIRQASSDFIVITDADGTYPNERVPELVQRCVDFDMVVGSRTGEGVQYSKLRAIPKRVLRTWVSWLCGVSVPDINSGLRVFRKDVVENYIGILPDTFSFTITITLAMLTNYRRVDFVPISYAKRIGRSKIKPVQDTLRFALLILRTGTYFAPLRAFAPIGGVLALLSIGSLIYDVAVLGNLTDKTVLLILFTLNTFMFAMLADMIDKRTSR